MQRFAGHAKRQAGDDHVDQGVAGHIDPLPEAVGAEEDRAGVLLEAFQHLGTGHAFGLVVEGQVPADEPAGHFRGDAAHQLVAGEQHERSAVRAIDVAFDQRGQHALEGFRLIPRIGNPAGQHQFCLAPVIEGAAQPQFLGLRQPDPRLEKFEGGLAADRQGGTGHDHRGDTVKQFAAEGGAHVQGGGFQVDSPHSPPRGAGLDPVDHVAQLLPAPVVDPAGQGLQPVGRRREILSLDLVLHPLTRLPHLTGQLFQLGAQRVRHRIRFVDPSVGPSLVGQVRLQFVKKNVCRIPTAVHLPLLAGQVEVYQQAFLGAVVVEPVQQVVDLPRRNAQPQMLGRHRFHHVCLVEHDRVVIGQDVAAAAAEGQIGKEEGVIDDQQLRVVHAAASLEIKASLVLGAFAAHAVAAVTGDLLPHGGQRAKGQVRAGTVVGLPRPGLQQPQLPQFVRLVKQRTVAIQSGLQAAAAEIVAPALDQHRGEFAGNDAVEQREVLGQQLLLETDGVGRNHHPPRAVPRRPRARIPRLVRRDRQDHRDKIGKALPHTGPRLDDQVLLVRQGPRHRLGHPHLLSTLLVAGPAHRNPPLGTQDVVNRQGHAIFTRGRPRPVGR